MSKQWKEIDNKQLTLKYKRHGFIRKLFGLPFLVIGIYLLVMFVVGVYQTAHSGLHTDLLEGGLALMAYLVVSLIFLAPGIFFTLFCETTIIHRHRHTIVHSLDFFVWKRKKEYSTTLFRAVELKYEHFTLKHQEKTILGRRSSEDVYSLGLIRSPDEPLVIAVDNTKESMVELGQLVSLYTGLTLVDQSDVDANLEELEQAELAEDFEREAEQEAYTKVTQEKRNRFEQRTTAAGERQYFFPTRFFLDPKNSLKILALAVGLLVATGILMKLLGPAWPFGIIVGILGGLMLLAFIGTLVTISLRIKDNELIITKTVARFSWKRRLLFSDIKKVRAAVDKSVKKHKFWSLEFRLHSGDVINTGATFDVKSAADQVVAEIKDHIEGKK